MSKSDFCECYWCALRRAVVIVSEPFVPDKKIGMCETCLKIRKSIFPFELVKYEVIKYKDA